MDTFNIVSGLITIVSFIFSWYIWYRAKKKEESYVQALRTVHNIAGDISWEISINNFEDTDARVMHTEKALRKVESIRRTTEHFIKSTYVGETGQLQILLERDIILTTANLFNIERSKKVLEVWILSKDLNPDVSDSAVGKMVYDNLKKGKKYTYFYPENNHKPDVLYEKLKNNIDPQNTIPDILSSDLKCVPIPGNYFFSMLSNGNLVLYFIDHKRLKSPKCYEEIVLTKRSERGLFWQEHNEHMAEKFKEFLSKYYA